MTAEPPSARLPVLFIAGSGRSGSTLLERMLSTVPGVCSGGEIVHLWTRGVLGNFLCGCGTPFRDCPFWTAVLERAFAGVEDGAMDDIGRLSAFVEGRSGLSLLRLPLQARRPPVRVIVERYARAVERVYRAIAAEARGALVVDGSKEPHHGYLLGRAPGLDVRVVHLVRDSRAVAFSWMRQKRRTEIAGRDVYLDRYPPMRSAARWLLAGIASETLARQGRAPLRVRYEDLVREPEATLGRVLAYAGLSLPIPALRQGALLAVTHGIGGNPMRLDHGALLTACDDEWKTAMRVRDRRLVTALTWPLLRRYGYRIREGA